MVKRTIYNPDGTIKEIRHDLPALECLLKPKQKKKKFKKIKSKSSKKNKLPRSKEKSYLIFKDILHNFYKEIRNSDKKRKLELLIKYADIKAYSNSSLSTKREQFNKKRNLLFKFNEPCFVCQVKPEIRHHIISLKNGGLNHWNNIVPLCKTCHAEIHPWLRDPIIIQAENILKELGNESDFILHAINNY